MRPIAHALSLLPLFAASNWAAPQAQTRPLDLPEVRASTPVERIAYHVYDVATERIRTVRESNPNDLELGTPPCFDNSTLTLPVIVAYAVASPGQDLFNWGRKFCRGSGLLRSFTIAYRSEAVDVLQGGPGATFSIALYSGAAGFGQPGTEIFRHTFAGLPTDSFASFLHVLTIDFTSAPLPLADGLFGWSYLQMDGDTGPILVRAPDLALATLDAMDLYGPGPARASNYQGTFHYGGCGTPNVPCANTWMQLDEILNSELALSAELNGSGTNPVLLHEALPARIGHTFVASVDVNPPRGTDAVVVLLGSRALAGPTTTRFGEVLIDLDQQAFPPLLDEGAFRFPIPFDRTLIGRRLYLQAALLPPTAPRLTLTNALRVRLGY